MSNANTKRVIPHDLELYGNSTVIKEFVLFVILMSEHEE